MLLLNFGKYNGKTLDQVPLKYLIFLIKTCKNTRPEVVETVRKIFDHDNNPNIDYVFNWGKYNSFDIKVVPINYLFWLVECDNKKVDDKYYFIKKFYQDSIDIAIKYLKLKRELSYSFPSYIKPSCPNITVDEMLTYLGSEECKEFREKY